MCQTRWSSLRMYRDTLAWHTPAIPVVVKVTFWLAPLREHAMPTVTGAERNQLVTVRLYHLLWISLYNLLHLICRDYFNRKPGRSYIWTGLNKYSGGRRRTTTNDQVRCEGKCHWSQHSVEKNKDAENAPPSFHAQYANGQGHNEQLHLHSNRPGQCSTCRNLQLHVAEQPNIII